MLRLMVLRGRIPRAAHAAALALVLLALVQGVATDRFFYDLAIVASGLLLAARVVLIREQRLAWAFMAAGLGFWAAGDLSFTVLADEPSAGGYPSFSDVMFVACYPCFTVGLIALARENLRGHTRLILLDGLTAGLATTSLALALLSGPATQLMSTPGTAYAATLAYPVCDFVLLAFAVGALAMSGKVWRRTWFLIAVGWALTGAADTMHVYDAANGGFQLGSTYDFVWPLSTVVLGWAGWQVAGRATPGPLRLGPVFAFPSLFALPALGVLVYDHFARVGLVPLVLATATIVMVFARVGIALRHLGVAHDAQLRVRERDAQALRLESLGELAGGVAHDFNNLLAVILNYSHFLATSLPEGDQRRADAEEIGRTAERAATMAHQLLLFSRRGMSRPEVVDVATGLTSMETMLRASINESVQLGIFTVENLPPVSMGAGQFDQIVLNLAVNARDAMPNGGRLSIFADEVRDQYLPEELQLAPGRYVRLTVRDTGAGMSACVQERAFEPFFSTKSVGHGTGLGLATVYGIVEHAGGAVEIQSREGAGTSVLVYLPAAAGVPAVDGPDDDLDVEDGDGELILLVEDEPALRLSTSRILSANGYEVLEAADGEEALTVAAAARRPIELLLTDVVMPNLSGVELARRLHAGERDIPVIFLSGYPTQVGDGVFDRHGQLLLKPVASTELLNAVRIALDTRVTA